MNLVWRKLSSCFIHGLVLLLVIAMLMPAFYMIMMSFKTDDEIASAPLAFPSRLYLDNYANALGAMDYSRSVLNSVGMTFAVTVLVALVGSLAAYPLAQNTNRLDRAMIMLVALGSCNACVCHYHAHICHFPRGRFAG